MRHEQAGIAGLLAATGSAYYERGLPLVQTLIAGGEIHLPTPAQAEFSPAMFAIAERAGIVAVRRFGEVSADHSPVQWREIRCRIELISAARLAVRLVANGVATRRIDGDALAGVTTALVRLAAGHPGTTLHDVRLYALDTEGHPRWRHPAPLPADIADSLPEAPLPLTGTRAAVITLSDRAAQGIYEDRSGARLAEMLLANGATLAHRAVLPDDGTALAANVRALTAANGLDLIVCTGGTGIGPRDITPETLLELGIKPIPGIGELLRAHSARIVRSAWISRAVAGTFGSCLVIALPGSHKAVAECLEVLLPLLPHTLSMLRGGSHG